MKIRIEFEIDADADDLDEQRTQITNELQDILDDDVLDRVVIVAGEEDEDEN